MSTDSNFLSKAEPSCANSLKSVNDEVRGIFVLKYSKKSIFDPLCKTNFSELVQILILQLKISLHVHFHQNRSKNNKVMAIVIKVSSLGISRSRLLYFGVQVQQFSNLQNGAKYYGTLHIYSSFHKTLRDGSHYCNIGGRVRRITLRGDPRDRKTYVALLQECSPALGRIP